MQRRPAAPPPCCNSAAPRCAHGVDPCRSGAATHRRSAMSLLRPLSTRASASTGCVLLACAAVLAATGPAQAREGPMEPMKSTAANGSSGRRLLRRPRCPNPWSIRATAKARPRRRPTGSSATSGRGPCRTPPHSPPCSNAPCRPAWMRAATRCGEVGVNGRLPAAARRAGMPPAPRPQPGLRWCEAGPRRAGVLPAARDAGAHGRPRGFGRTSS